MSRSEADSRLVWGLWALTAVVVAATVAILLVAGRRSQPLHQYEDTAGPEPQEHEIAARAGSSVLYHEDLVLVGISDPRILHEWVNDQLLADLAVEQGLENPRKSRLLQDRVRQLYLRDELLSRVYAGIHFPDSAEVMGFMLSDPPLYMTERHYWQILLADSQMADSVHQRLEWGENFQLTAENLSLGQKAGIGGDLGFMTAGELMAYGIPREMALMEGLGEPVESPYGWHIFMVDETRPLEDTSRVVWTVADDLYRMRLASARDSILERASESAEIYIDPLYSDGMTVQGENTQGVDSE